MPRAEGGAKIFGVFRVKNHDFTPKNHIFSNFRSAPGTTAWIETNHDRNRPTVLITCPTCMYLSAPQLSPSSEVAQVVQGVLYLNCPHSLHTNTSPVVCPSITLILVDILDVSQPILIKFSKHIQYNSSKPYSSFKVIV